LDITISDGIVLDKRIFDWYIMDCSEYFITYTITFLYSLFICIYFICIMSILWVI